MRRLIPLLLLAGLVAVLWSSTEDTPEPAEPFLGVVETDGRALLVHSLDTGAPAEDARFVLVRPDGSGARTRSGVPRAVAPAGDASFIVFFDDGATVIHWSEDAESLDWERVAYPDPTFRPLAAALAADGTVLAAGRVESQPDALVWGRLREGAFALEDGTIAADRSARAFALAADLDGAWVAWAVASSSGYDIFSSPLPPDPARPPRSILQIDDVRAATTVTLADGPSLVVVGGGGRLVIVRGRGGPVRTGHLEGLGDSGPLRLVTVRGEERRLIALSEGRLLTWRLSETALPESSLPAALNEPPDVRWVLLALAAATAVTIAVLVILGSRAPPRGAPEPAEGTLELAGLGRRLAAWLLDMLLLAPALILAAGEVLEVSPSRLVGLPLFRASSDTEAQNLVLTVEVALLVYFIVAETLFAQTLGKRALFIRTVRLDGGRAGLPAIVVRNLLRVLVDVYGGALLALMSARRQRVGDWLARTVVVRVRPAPGAEEDSDPEGAPPSGEPG